jgi:hypothetical protein
MGFLSRLRQGSRYAPSAGPAVPPDDQRERPGDASGIDAAAMPGDESASAALGERGASLMPTLGRPVPGQRISAGERAFMEARRGSRE